MVKKYDFKLAVELIEREKPLGLVTATMLMRADWFWTAEDVWNKEDGYLKIYVSMSGEDKVYKTILDDDVKIGGIDGSMWETPIIELTYEDGKKWTLDCHDGGVSDRGKPLWILKDEIIK